MLCSRLVLVLLCATIPVKAHAVAVRITETDGSHVQTELHPGDILRVDLAAEPVTGRTWSVQGHAPSQLMELGATQRVFGGRMSNQGRSSFSWRAIADGKGELTMVYGTSTSRASKPDKSITIEITVMGDPLGPEDAHPQPISQLEQTAIYERTQPCGDCSRLVERLTLLHGPQESPVVLKRTYRDAPGGTLTSIATGSWAAEKGTSDPTATVYTVTTGAETSLFKLEGDRLLPLDAQQVPVAAPPGVDHTFHRINGPMP